MDQTKTPRQKSKKRSDFEKTQLEFKKLKEDKKFFIVLKKGYFP